MAWMTQEKASRFHGVTIRTLRNWVREYGVRKRIRDGQVQYHSGDLEIAEYRGSHRGVKPYWV